MGGEGVGEAPGVISSFTDPPPAPPLSAFVPAGMWYTPPPTHPTLCAVATAVLSATPHLCWYTSASPPPPRRALTAAAAPFLTACQG